MLSLLIAVVSFLLSRVHPSFDALVVSIIFGMLISNGLANRDFLAKGIDRMLRFALPVGIALYGTQLTFTNSIGYATWLSIVIVFLFSFLMSILIGRALRLPGKLSLLLASGFSICGASAIAVISPLLRAKREDTSISVIAIMVMGLTAVILYPIFPEVFGLDVREFAFLSGTTIPMLGQVKIVARDAGADVLAMALKFKLIRVSMILFVSVGILVFHGRKEKRPSIPWFMVAFVVLALLANTVEAAASLARMMEPVCVFLLSSALAAVGLSVDFDSITSEGARPLLAVFASWGALIIFIVVGLRLFHV